MKVITWHIILSLIFDSFHGLSGKNKLAKTDILPKTNENTFFYYLYSGRVCHMQFGHYFDKQACCNEPVKLVYMPLKPDLAFRWNSRS
jgi:hypothetical protein